MSDQIIVENNPRPLGRMGAVAPALDPSVVREIPRSHFPEPPSQITDFPAGSGGRGWYFGQVIDFEKEAPWIASPPARFGSYWASDHMVGAGGIWLLTSGQQCGPWTVYTPSGGAAGDPIFVDGTDLSTETPTVWADASQEKLYMLYHQRVSSGSGIQYTKRVEANGFDDWTNPVTVLQLPSYHAHDNFHTGYARSSWINGRQVLTHRIEGRGLSYVVSYSEDNCDTIVTDDRSYLGTNNMILGTAAEPCRFAPPNIVRIAGQYWAITSGRAGTGTVDSDLYAWTLAPDLITPTSRAQILIARGAPGAWNQGLTMPRVSVHDGLVVITVTGRDSGDSAVAIDRIGQYVITEDAWAASF